MDRPLTKFDRSQRHRERARGTYFHYPDFDLVPPSHLYCLSENTITLVYQLVREYGKWRNRFVIDTAADVWHGLLDEEWANVQDWYDQALEELKMPICNEITAGLTEIANAIKLLDTGHSGGGCCCPGGGNVYGDDPAPPATAPGNPDTDPPPDGFPTWEAFTAYKCRAANKMTDDLIQTMANMASVPGFVGGLAGVALYALLQTSLLSGVIVGLMALGLSAAGAIAVLLTAFIALIAGGTGLLAYFTAVANAMTADKDSLVCDLYNAGSVEEAQSALRSFVSDVAGDLSYDNIDEENLFTSKIADIVIALTGTDVINALFEENGEISQYVGSVDCSGCPDDGTGAIQFAPVFGDTIPLGQGDLIADGSIRTLTATQRQTVSQKCVAFSVNGLNWAGGLGDCSSLPVGQTHFYLKIVAQSSAAYIGFLSNGSQFVTCDNGTLRRNFPRPAQTNPVLGTWYVCTHFGIISQSQNFTINVAISADYPSDGDPVDEILVDPV